MVFKVLSNLQTLNHVGFQISSLISLCQFKRMLAENDSFLCSLSANKIGPMALLALAKGFRINDSMTKLNSNPKGSKRVRPKTKSILGTGQFGSVHIATYGRGDLSEGVVKKSHGTNNREEIYERLILQGLPEHRNVVRLSAVSVKDTLILEIHKGGSLKEYAKKNKGGIPLRQFLHYSHGMCQAIQHIHENGLVHRDIALRNYVLSEDLQRVVLVDFGLSWPIGEEKEVTIRPVEKMPFRQCAPEVFTTLLYSKAADIWQLGLAMWQMLHGGRQPFSQFVNSQQLSKFFTKKMVQEKAPIPIYFKKQASLALIKTVKEAVTFCCTYEPAARPSAAEIVEKIESLQGSVGDEFEEEKEMLKYKPDEKAVQDGLKAYNFTDYELKLTEGQGAYRELENDLEDCEYGELDEFPDVDFEEAGDDVEYAELDE